MDAGALIIGYNKSEKGDFSALSVCRCKGELLVCVNTFIGKEADELYKKLTIPQALTKDKPEPKEDEHNPQLRYLQNAYDGDFNPKSEKEKK